MFVVLFMIVATAIPMSERISDSEVEVGIATPARVYQRPAFLVHRRVVGLEAKVEAQQEVCEIEADAKAVGGCDFLVEFVELKLPAGLVGIVLYGPYVAGIDK